MVWAYTLMCLIYGTTFLAIRAGDDAGMPPFLFAALRFAAAGILTLAVVYFRNRSAFPKSSKIYLSLASVGFFNTTAVFAIVYYVEQFVPSGYSALMASTMPFLVLVLGGVKNKQAITVLQIVGLVLGLVGMLAIAWPGIHDGVPHWIPSTIVLFIAQVFASIGAIQSRTILDQHVSPFIVNGFQVLFGSVGLFILSAFTEGLSLRHVHAMGYGMMALAYLTVMGSIVASTLYFWLVRRINAMIASTWTYVSPVIAVAVGYWWYREPVYTLTIIGTAVILAGVFLLNFRAFREVYLAHRVAVETGTPTSAGSVARVAAAGGSSGDGVMDQ